MGDRPLRIALFTYSTRPRGGVVHSLALGEALAGLGHSVHLFALEKPGRSGFFRRTTVPATFIPVAEVADESMDDRITRYIDAYVAFLENDLARGSAYDVYHAEDCISANALIRIRESGRVPAVVRTVHHVDDFVSPALIHCQLASITEPDLVLVVSEMWRRRLALEFDVHAPVVHNGVDLARFAPPSDAAAREAERVRMGLSGSVAVLAVGGVEPRKNTRVLLDAFVRARAQLASGSGRQPLLLIAGGETLFDYRPYRDSFEQDLARLVTSNRLSPDSVRNLGSVTDEHLAALYRAADVLAFPSVKEGWGLVVLEAQASGTPVVASDIDVLREYLVDGENALLVPPEDAAALGRALVRATTDPVLIDRLRTHGFETARRYDWGSSARRHVDAYRRLAG